MIIDDILVVCFAAWGLEGVVWLITDATLFNIRDIGQKAYKMRIDYIYL